MSTSPEKANLKIKAKSITLGFIFDNPLYEDEKHDFYTINLNYELWRDRYLPIFHNIIFASRHKKCYYSQIPKGYTIVNGKNLLVLPIPSYNNAKDTLFHYRRIKKELNAVIDKSNVIIIRLPSPLGSLACHLCKKLKKPYMIELVADAKQIYKYHNHPLSRVAAPIIHHITKRQCKNAPRILYVTSNYLQERYPTKGVKAGISDVIIPKTNKQTLNNRLAKIEQKQKTIKIGLVGKLGYAPKGHKTALKAIKILNNHKVKTKLELVGSGDSSAIEKLMDAYNLSQQQIIVKGALQSGKQMFDWIDNIDILIIPSLTEGLPRIAVEAMSRGCPIVASNVGGIPELINSQYLHQPKNAKQLANILYTIINDRKILKQMAIKNYTASLDYTQDSLNQKRNIFFQNFIEDQQNG